MTLSNVIGASVWDRFQSPPRRNSSAIKDSRAIFEFDNRRRNKIFTHRAGDITLRGDINLDQSRNRVIEENYGVRNTSGYAYHSISHTHTPPTILENDPYVVLCHGPSGNNGWENCAAIGSTCSEGESDTKCERGKCRIGTLSQSGNLWRYDSLTVPGLYYFIREDEDSRALQLKTIARGVFSLPAGAGTVNVNRLASISATVYTPPSTYLANTFTRSIISYYDAGSNLISLQDTCDNFVRGVLGSDLIGQERVSRSLVDRIVSGLSDNIPPDWTNLVSSLLEQIWLERYEGEDTTNRDFAIAAYNTLSLAFSSAVQVIRSGIKISSLKYNSDVPRPIFNRLPGISGAYNSDSEDGVAKWLTSGADMALGDAKLLLDRFYENYLDPQTAYAPNLDWIAQHMGFMNVMWDLDWPNATKRLLLRFAHSGIGADLISSLFTLDPDEQTLHRVDKGHLETLVVDEETEGVDTDVRYFQRIYNVDTGLVTLEPISTLKIDVSDWPGLIPSRGGMTALLFLFEIFNIRAFSGTELIYDSDTGTYRVRDGLRRSEQTAPVNLPYVVDTLHVGTEGDSEVYNYPNQLIADISTCYDSEESNKVIVRMPFYYNRNGRTWDRARVILEGWMPVSAQARLQYAYGASDLLVAEDTFFEPT